MTIIQTFLLMVTSVIIGGISAKSSYFFSKLPDDPILEIIYVIPYMASSMTVAISTIAFLVGIGWLIYDLLNPYFYLLGKV